MPTVSVIIPCYNRATLIGETIQNMLDQLNPPHEIIVIDDGSVDNSVDVIRSFGSKVKLIQQTNQGPGAARNAGLRASTGDFIQFMDSDDLASINKLEVQTGALANSKADFAYGPWVRCIIGDHSIRFTDKILQAEAVPGDKPMLEYFLSGWSLIFQNCLFKRQLLEKAGFYRTDLITAEDSEFFIRILSLKPSCIHTPECLLFYREHTSDKLTVSGASAKQRALDWTYFLEITGRHIATHLPAMKLSTRISIAAAIKNHLDQCLVLDVPGLAADHPYFKISFPFFKLRRNTHILFSKIRRRLMKTPDYHTGFKRQTAGARHKQLVTQMKYKFINV